MNKLSAIITVGTVLAVCASAQVSRAADPAVPAAESAPAPVAPAQGSAPPPPPAKATADFDRAVELVRAGKDAEAEVQFGQIAASYPAYAGALVNLGILYRKHGELDKSDAVLHTAVQREPGDAEAFNELGVTLRLEGKFHEAADAYNQAIMAKPDFAPAYRNLAIVLDLYLGDTAGALTAMEHYKDLAADDKAVAGWLADLKQRAGKNAAPPAPDRAGGST